MNRHVPCALPRCTATPLRVEAVPVSVEFDGRRLRGLVCTDEHAAELRRGWETRDAFGPEFTTVQNPSVKTG